MTWNQVRLGDVLDVPLANGRSVPTRESGFPVLRLNAIVDGRIDLSQRKGGAWDQVSAAPYLVRQGDLLVARGSGSLSKVGAAGLMDREPDEVAFPDTMVRVRASQSILEPRFLVRLWGSPVIRSQIEPTARTTAGIYKINQRDLASLVLPCPPLAEQRRIVEILEGHLSRLDRAQACVDTAGKRGRAFTRSVLLRHIPDTEAYPELWTRSTVAEAGSVQLGRQRHPDWHHGPNMKPYLRVANVFENRIDTRDVMQMHWPDGSFERFRLHPGDLLLNEGQTPELLGRPAIYRGDPQETAFTNSLLRFRARTDVRPEFALLVFRRHMHAGRFTRESRITTNIAHLSASRLKPIEFPIPPLEEQDALIASASDQFAAADRIEHARLESAKRGLALRRALLTAAFSGQLTGRDSDLERAEEAIEA